MNMCARIYYNINNGEVIKITNEQCGFIYERDIVEDLKEFQIDINIVDFIELEYGTLGATFNNIKSYSINLESKKLECVYITPEEVHEIQIKIEEELILDNKVADISSYLMEQPGETIESIEDYILQTELNKVMEGLI